MILLLHNVYVCIHRLLLSPSTMRGGCKIKCKVHPKNTIVLMQSVNLCIPHLLILRSASFYRMVISAGASSNTLPSPFTLIADAKRKPLHISRARACDIMPAAMYVQALRMLKTKHV